MSTENWNANLQKPYYFIALPIIYLFLDIWSLIWRTYCSSMHVASESKSRSWLNLAIYNSAGLDRPQPYPAQGRIQVVRFWRLAPKTYVGNFIHHCFVQFRKQHARLKAILSSIILSQQCCEVYFISLTVAKPIWDLTTRYSITEIAPPLKLLAKSPLILCNLSREKFQEMNYRMKPFHIR